MGIGAGVIEIARRRVLPRRFDNIVEHLQISIIRSLEAWMTRRLSIVGILPPVVLLPRPRPRPYALQHAQAQANTESKCNHDTTDDDADTGSQTEAIPGLLDNKITDCLSVGTRRGRGRRSGRRIRSHNANRHRPCRLRLLSRAAITTQHDSSYCVGREIRKTM